MDTQEHKEHKVRVLLQDPVAMAKQRLMDFADKLSGQKNYNYEGDGEGETVTYTELINRAAQFQQRGEYWCEGSRFEDTKFYDTFWDDYKLVTGKPITNTYGFFSCSC